ncbi:hypothetical protein TIFTF001_045466 [Ficus carica]|uniref:Uncharacterized protein n=1 Tax=Ficus carica TaxID=3494 RepID=A0AA87YRU1_FICCA|nr:hypothetical protein TIFTF001_045459 [Ficus carica]GMN21202.1 hypothetical protein TIFTF001_045462 [Ficus carica]GMN21208.1 hypothetical protein TIFTF001_045463 [Ficus carica]GMN21225.1 hypothetical protein TIFTF001_045466 [Ficus carica]
MRSQQLSTDPVVICNVVALAARRSTTNITLSLSLSLPASLSRLCARSRRSDHIISLSYNVFPPNLLISVFICLDMDPYLIGTCTTLKSPPSPSSGSPIMTIISRDHRLKEKVPP